MSHQASQVTWPENARVIINHAQDLACQFADLPFKDSKRYLSQVYTAVLVDLYTFRAGRPNKCTYNINKNFKIQHNKYPTTILTSNPTLLDPPYLPYTFEPPPLPSHHPFQPGPLREIGDNILFGYPDRFQSAFTDTQHIHNDIRYHENDSLDKMHQTDMIFHNPTTNFTHITRFRPPINNNITTEQMNAIRANSLIHPVTNDNLARYDNKIIRTMPVDAVPSQQKLQTIFGEILG